MSRTVALEPITMMPCMPERAHAPSDADTLGRALVRLQDLLEQNDGRFFWTLPLDDRSERRYEDSWTRPQGWMYLEAWYLSRILIDRRAALVEFDLIAVDCDLHPCSTHFDEDLLGQWKQVLGFAATAPSPTSVGSEVPALVSQERGSSLGSTLLHMNVAGQAASVRRYAIEGDEMPPGWTLPGPSTPTQWPPPNPRPAVEKNGVSGTEHHRPRGWEVLVDGLCDIDCVCRVRYDNAARGGSTVRVIDGDRGIIGVRYGSAGQDLPLLVETTARGTAQTELVAEFIRAMM